MKRKKNDNILSSLWCFFMGFFFFLSGIYTVITGKGLQRGEITIPPETGWLTAPFGFWILWITVKSCWRNKQEAKREAAAAALEEKEREAQGDVASGEDKGESQKDDTPPGGV